VRRVRTYLWPSSTGQIIRRTKKSASTTVEEHGGSTTNAGNLRGAHRFLRAEARSSRLKPTPRVAHTSVCSGELQLAVSLRLCRAARLGICVVLCIVSNPAEPANPVDESPVRSTDGSQCDIITGEQARGRLRSCRPP